MRADFLDPYSGRDSVIHRLPAGLKLAAALVLILVVLSLPRTWWIGAIILAAALLVVGLLARIPTLFFLRRLLMLEPFVASVALLALFQPDGGRRFAELMIRSSLCLWVTLLLANTTPLWRIIDILRRLRVPSLLLTTLALAYRYLFVLVDETHRLRRARASRTFDASRRRSWSAAANVIGTLFVRVSERSERIYAAMCARGWQ